MNEQTRNDVIYQKSILEDAIKDGTIKEPALFWAGRMSQTIQRGYQATIPNISDYFELLKVYSEKYDEIIFGRMDIKK